jgi:hypothetical protein
VKLLAVLALLILLPIFAAAQDIHKWKDGNGQWNITNTPPPLPPEDPLTPSPECTPFHVGEIRRMDKSRLVPRTSHYVGVESLDLKLAEVDTKAARFDWLLSIKNDATVDGKLLAKIRFYDCSGFLIGESVVQWRRIPPKAATQLGGRATVSGGSARRVGLFELIVNP